MKPSTASQPKLGLIFLGRRRPGFDQEWGRGMEERVRALLGGMNELVVVDPGEKAVDEASMQRAMAACTREAADAIVVLQTTMGDGRLAPTLAQLWPDPVVLWATPEKPDGDMISSCSLVGTHCWASIMRQQRHAFELVYGDPAQDGVRTRLLEAVRLAATARRLRHVRLGLIGGQAPGYFAMAADPFVMQRTLGVQVQSHSLLEFSATLQELSAEAVAADVAAVRAMGLPHKDTNDDDLPMASRMYLAMRAYLQHERYDALTVRCWPEMSNVFGQWPYFGIARLAEEGFAVACEGDADGALTAWVGESLGFGRCYLSDWLEHDHQTITTWHIGATPPSFSPPVGQSGGPRIARHFNNKKPSVLEASLIEDMPVTIARLWRCDGAYWLTAREGRTIRPRRHLMATNGLVQMDHTDPGVWFDDLCHAGMPHHVALFKGRHEACLRRFARNLNLNFL